MGFLRNQEKRMAMRLLAWKYQRMNLALPPADKLEIQAANLVDEAHRIARQRGRNVMGILKDLVEDIKKNK